jgi:pimeloyl-ACP methyl ester carboxylesterase
MKTLLVCCFAMLVAQPAMAKRPTRLSPMSDIIRGMANMQVRQLRQSSLVRPFLGAKRKAPPAGKNKPVLVLPGFMSSDGIMKPLMKPLRDAGYKAYNANITLNVGSMPGRVKQVIGLLEQTKRQTGQRSVIVGHSLGGVLGRTVASLRPDLVRAVVGVASPLGVHSSSKSKRSTKHVNDTLLKVSGMLMQGTGILLQPVPKVPMYSIRARQDGLLDPRSCVVAGGRSRNMTVPGGHTGAPYEQKTIDNLLFKILPRL